MCLSLHLSPSRKKKVRCRIWIYKQADFEGENDLLQCTPSGIYYDSDVNYFWMKWCDLFLITMDSCIPSKNISSTKSLPYINRGLRLLIHKKHRCFKQAKNLKLEQTWNKYNKSRNKVTSALRIARKAFFDNLSQSVKTPKDFWATYNCLSPSRLGTPNNLTYQSQTAKGSSDKADLLNSFFASCFSPSPLHFLTQSASVSTSTSSLSHITCSEEDVFRLLSTYKAKTASGPDGISRTMLRGTAESIYPVLTALFNCSLRQGVVPSDWKISNVIPIPKSGDPSLATNYRPI